MKSIAEGYDTIRLLANILFGKVADLLKTKKVDVKTRVNANATGEPSRSKLWIARGMLSRGSRTASA